MFNRRQALAASAAAVGSPLLQPKAAIAAILSRPAPLALGRDQPFDHGWRFFLGEGDGPEAPGFDDAAWRIVDLPHDWSIEDLPPGPGRIGPFDPASLGKTATGFTLGGEGWYRKRFTIDALPANGRVEILFDGVYKQSDVWLNGQHLGQRVHGYAPFAYDLTPHLRRGQENVLTVRARNLGRNSRWYAGSGIYRGVTVDVLAEPAHVARWGVYAVTKAITEEAATIAVETTVVEPGAGLTLVTRLRNAAGAVAAETRSPATALVQQTLNLSKPRLWSPDSPALYSLETELRRGDKLVDRTVSRFGVRIVTFTPDAGMQINGQTVKLRGGCVHHDNGLLGAAAHKDAEVRRVALLKARGFNAVRSSHYPSSRAFAEACDAQGMFLIEEAFDMWRSPKTPQDYAADFDNNWRADLSAMVLSARSRPSVIMWSIGNEVPHRATPEGIETSWNLANAVRRLDPSRPVTAALNGFLGRPVVADEATARKGFANVPDNAAAVFLDVVGYNYRLDRYVSDHQDHPRRVIFGSESFPKEVFQAWDLIEKTPYVIGDFTWTAMDYLGEAGLATAVRDKIKKGMPMQGAWPWVGANCGDLDWNGRQKAASLARDVVWRISPVEMTVQRPLEPRTYEHPSPWAWSDELASWTWPGWERQPLNVRIYARADRVELLLNGEAVAARDVTLADKLPLEFQVPYAPGVLEVVAYKAGREIGRRRLETTGAPIKLQLSFEQKTGSAQRGSLSYLWIEIADARGRAVPDLARKVGLSLSGPATLVGFGGAAPLALGSFQSAQAMTHDGRALAILRSNGGAGLVRISAQSEGLTPGLAILRLT
jgi:beta-galactosidase